VKAQRQSSSGESTGCLHGTLEQDEVILGDQDSNKVRRIVRQVDGVVDMEIEALSSSFQQGMQLELETQIDVSHATYKDVKPGHARLQDGVSRVSVLVSPTTVPIVSNGNKLHVIISKDMLPIRIRLLSEDVDTFHEGAKDEENYFGKLMIKDFYYPVEAFYEG